MPATSVRGDLLYLRLSRSRMLRIFGIPPQRLVYWERQGLIPYRLAYEGYELLALRKLQQFTHERVPARTIRESLQVLYRQGLDSEQAWEQLRAEPQRRKLLQIQTAGQEIELASGQLRLPLRPALPASLIEFQIPRKQRAAEAEMWFSYAVSLEDRPGEREQAATAYRHCLELDPDFASAAINLGTLHYHQGEFSEAERYYRRALEIHPSYALAFFDLGNVLDETGRPMEAIEAYTQAVTFSANYADAHYNLALALEKSGQRRKALRHWRRYLQIDGYGPWAEHARRQIERSLQKENLKRVK